MNRDAVHEIARGRVWTGADALQRGLIDELGGMRRAAEIARERAGLAPEAPVRLVPAVPPLQRLRQPRNSDDPTAFAASRGLGATVSDWGARTRLAEAIGLYSGGPLLTQIEPLR
jgi:protease-4